MTRADWYASNTRGGWRTARKPHRCDQLDEYQLRCMTRIQPGQRYFDTNQHNPRSHSQYGTLRLCEACATKEIR